MDQQPNQNVQSEDSGHRPIILNRRLSGIRKASDSVTKNETKNVIIPKLETPHNCGTGTPPFGIAPQENLFSPTVNLQPTFYPCRNMDLSNYQGAGTQFSASDTTYLTPPTVFYEVEEPSFSQPFVNVANLRNAMQPYNFNGQQTIIKGCQDSIIPIHKRRKYTPRSFYTCYGKRKKENITSGNQFQSVPVQQKSRDEENLQPTLQFPLLHGGGASLANASQILLSPVRQEACSQESGMNDSLTGITWLGHMETHKILPCTGIRPINMRNLERGRPPYSYMALIQFAINSCPSRRMTLRQIYYWIEETFPYFKIAKPGWKNSIRHNLSLHDIFVREVSPASKTSYWTLRPDLNQRPLTLEYISKMNATSIQRFDSFGNSPSPEMNYVGGFHYQEPQPPCVVFPLHTNEKSTGKNPHIQEQYPCTSKQIKQEPVEPDFPSYQLDNPFFGLTAMSDATGELEEQYKKNRTEMRKRQRKQPMKTLNDSLNESLQFADCSPLTSPKSVETSLNNSRTIHLDSNNNPLKFSFAENDFVGSSQQIFSPENFFNALEDNHTGPTIKKEIEEQGEGCSRTLPTSGRESPLVECLPQIFGGDTFAYNSSFSKFLNASGISFFNLSADRSAQLSEGDDVNSASTSYAPTTK